MKFSRAAVFSLLFFSNNLFSQTDIPQTDIPLTYAETISATDLKKHLSIVASAEMEGRETGTIGQRRAEEYIKNQFIETGLQSPPALNGYAQNYPLVTDTLIPRTLKIGRKKYEFGTDYIITPGSGQGDEFKSDLVIFAGYGISDSSYDDYSGREVKGKIVVVFSGEPWAGGKSLISGTAKPSSWAKGSSKKAVLARQKGAVALMMIDPSIDTLSSRLADNSRKSNLYMPAENTNAEKVPVVLITSSVAKNIFDDKQISPVIASAKSREPLKEIALAKKMKTKLRYKKITITSEAANVIGYIEGTDKKDEYVFLTAHYDHLGKKGNVIYFGADDDGSGTVSVIEMAEAFAKAKAEGHGPRRTIVFMTVSGEEKGLWGSEYYADHPVFPLENTSIDLNTDMVGRIDKGRKNSDTNYIYVIGNDKVSTDLGPIVTSTNDKYPRLNIDYKYNDPDDPQRIYYRSDHYNFAKNGVPVLFFFDGIHEDYHKPTDTVDKINFSLMEKRVRYIFLIAWDIANREKMLKRDLGIPAGVR